MAEKRNTEKVTIYESETGTKIEANNNYSSENNCSQHQCEECPFFHGDNECGGECKYPALNKAVEYSLVKNIMIEKHVENIHFDDDFVPPEDFREDLMLSSHHPCYKCPFFGGDDDTDEVWCVLLGDTDSLECPIKDSLNNRQSK